MLSVGQRIEMRLVRVRLPILADTLQQALENLIQVIQKKRGEKKNGQIIFGREIIQKKNVLDSLELFYTFITQGIDVGNISYRQRANIVMSVSLESGRSVSPINP